MIELKAYRNEDLDALYQLFYNTVHHTNASDYTSEQLNAWAPTQFDRKAWNTRLTNQYTQLAWINEELVGFGSLKDGGLIDFLYVDSQYRRQGIGQLIYYRLEFEASEKELKRLFAEVSITAKPFFEKVQFKVVSPQDKTVRGVTLKNYVMEKNLY